MARMLLTLLLVALVPRTVSSAVLLGSDLLARDQFRPLQGKRVGLLTNPSGVNSKGVSTTDLLRKAPGVRLVALYGPEHGYYGLEKAGKHLQDGKDRRTGLPVYSLYGEHRKPTPEMLKGIDVMVYDLQDIGVRSYTYISTLGKAMEACAEAGVEFVVLDRPNPLGGERVEGPMVHRAFESFVSQWNIPYLYGMTCGELARMINGEGWIAKRCRLSVIPMEGWRRSMLWSDTGLAWVQTSPYIPNFESAVMLAATGIIGEIGGISIGSATGFHRWISSPSFTPERLVQHLKQQPLPGIEFSVAWNPKPSGRVKETRLVVKEPRTAPLVAVNYYLIEAVHQASDRNLFAEAKSTRVGMFDKVSGSSSLRTGIEKKKPVRQMVQEWRAGEEAFRKARKPFLLYPP